MAIAVAAIRLCRSLLACASSSTLPFSSRLTVESSSLIDCSSSRPVSSSSVAERSSSFIACSSSLLAFSSSVEPSYCSHGVAQVRLQPLDLALELARGVGPLRGSGRRPPRLVRPARVRTRRETHRVQFPRPAPRAHRPTRAGLPARPAPGRRSQASGSARRGNSAARSSMRSIGCTARSRFVVGSPPANCRKRPAFSERCRISCSALTSTDGGARRSISLPCISPQDTARCCGQSRSVALASDRLDRAALGLRLALSSLFEHSRPVRWRRPAPAIRAVTPAAGRRAVASCRAAVNSRSAVVDRLGRRRATAGLRAVARSARCRSSSAARRGSGRSADCGTR